MSVSDILSSIGVVTLAEFRRRIQFTSDSILTSCLEAVLQSEFICDPTTSPYVCILLSAVSEPILFAHSGFLSLMAKFDLQSVLGAAPLAFCLCLQRCSDYCKAADGVLRLRSVAVASALQNLFGRQSPQPGLYSVVYGYALEAAVFANNPSFVGSLLGKFPFVDLDAPYPGCKTHLLRSMCLYFAIGSSAAVMFPSHSFAQRFHRGSLLQLCCSFSEIAFHLHLLAGTASNVELQLRSRYKVAQLLSTCHALARDGPQGPVPVRDIPPAPSSRPSGGDGALFPRGDLLGLSLSIPPGLIESSLDRVLSLEGLFHDARRSFVLYCPTAVLGNRSLPNQLRSAEEAAASLEALRAACTAAADLVEQYDPLFAVMLLKLPAAALAASLTDAVLTRFTRIPVEYLQPFFPPTSPLGRHGILAGLASLIVDHGLACVLDLTGSPSSPALVVQPVAATVQMEDDLSRALAAAALVQRILPISRPRSRFGQKKKKIVER